MDRVAAMPAAAMPPAAQAQSHASCNLLTARARRRVAWLVLVDLWTLWIFGPPCCHMQRTVVETGRAEDLLIMKIRDSLWREKPAKIGRSAALYI